jgi:hypothetical protein
MTASCFRLHNALSHVLLALWSAHVDDSQVQPELAIDGGVAKYRGVPFMTSKGPVTVATLAAAAIK